jgi:hypothetical protein
MEPDRTDGRIRNERHADGSPRRTNTRQVYSGIKAKKPLEVVIEPPATGKSLPSIGNLQVDKEAIKEYFTELHDLMSARHAQVSEISAAVQRKYRLQQDQKVGARKLEIEPGQYVMLTDPTPQVSKLNVNRSGPHQVISIGSEHRITIEDIVTGKQTKCTQVDSNTMIRKS